MKFEIIILIVTGYIMYVHHTNDNLIERFMKWKKHAKTIGIGLFGFSLFLFIRKNPNEGKNIVHSLSELIKNAPIDRNAQDFISPILNYGSSTRKNVRYTTYEEDAGFVESPIKPMKGMEEVDIPTFNYDSASPQQKRMLNSGKNPKSRSVSETKKKFVASQQGWKCAQCKKTLNAWFEIDHVRPLEYGGTNEVGNLSALCRDCHGEKTASNRHM